VEAYRSGKWRNPEINKTQAFSRHHDGEVADSCCFYRQVKMVISLIFFNPIFFRKKRHREIELVLDRE